MPDQPDSAATRELRVPELVWEAARVQADREGVPFDQALQALVRAYAYGRLSVVTSDDGHLNIMVPVVVP